MPEFATKVAAATKRTMPACKRRRPFLPKTRTQSKSTRSAACRKKTVRLRMQPASLSQSQPPHDTRGQRKAPPLPLFCHRADREEERREKRASRPLSLIQGPPEPQWQRPSPCRCHTLRGVFCGGTQGCSCTSRTSDAHEGAHRCTRDNRCGVSRAHRRDERGRLYTRGASARARTRIQPRTPCTDCAVGHGGRNSSPHSPCT
mmetsp:Transcript_2071/g.4365  ORF Transcript_2071/g.4365 Transcript_2071/m.4365 type:complete len:203 (-) Transcript_2071:931-1539(-)